MLLIVWQCWARKRRLGSGMLVSRGFMDAKMMMKRGIKKMIR